MSKYSVSEIINDIKMIERRPNWDEYFLMNSYLISKRSTCERLHVGCVIVQDKRIVTTGYNGHIKGAPHVSKVEDGHEQMTIHAEQNAIADAAARGIKVAGSIAYMTHYPCINCAKNLIAAGVKQVIYVEDYNNNPICEELYKLANVQINKFSL